VEVESVVVVAPAVAIDVDASAVGTIEGAWMMTVLVLVEVRPDWSVAT